MRRNSWPNPIPGQKYLKSKNFKKNNRSLQKIRVQPQEDQRKLINQHSQIIQDQRFSKTFIRRSSEIIQPIFEFEPKIDKYRYFASTFMLMLIIVGTIQYRAEYVPKEIRVVLIGSMGSGKSTLGNALVGREVFQTGYGQGSYTLESIEANGTFFGRPISVIDTQGHDDSLGRDYYHSDQLLQLLKNKPFVNAFIYLLVLEGHRMSDNSWQRLNLYRDSFVGFTDYVIFVVSFWHYDDESISRRQQKNMTDEYAIQQLLIDFSDRGYKVREDQILFIDTFYNSKHSLQKEKFENSTYQLFKMITSKAKYNFFEEDKLLTQTKRVYELNQNIYKRSQEQEARRQKKAELERQKKEELKKKQEECEQSIYCRMFGGEKDEENLINNDIDQNLDL
ncbi:gtpase imap family member 4-partial [Stylonychia lemnae]|uniref:Gtpase imap family member 4-partial n=1 Tax=Stylonychia lemnae TaxID=5949 RepID=A0A078B2A3_STYLE|nr:gtpase imap family member 4-partial [Stylonychia lemnae]